MSFIISEVRTAKPSPEATNPEKEPYRSLLWVTAIAMMRKKPDGFIGDNI